jgi:hypothetical protein
MRIFRMAGAGGLALLLAACPGDRTMDEQVGLETPPPTMDPAPAPMMAAQTVQLEPVQESGVSGTATLTPRNGRTEVRLMAQAPPNMDLEARIHRGTCQAPGEAVANLSNVGVDAAGTGQSETDVGHSINLLADGQHVVVLLPAGADVGQAPVACAPIQGAAGMGTAGTGTTTGTGTGY